MIKLHNWADVAHHYAKSNLSIIVGKFDHGPEMGMIFSTGLHENCAWAEHGIWCEIEDGAFVSNWESHKPILIHRDDMTDEQARECFKIYDGTEDAVLSDVTDVLYFDPNQMASTLEVWIGDPAVWHHLIAKGFDLFGLIESGQAIRKERLNG